MKIGEANQDRRHQPPPRRNREKNDPPRDMLLAAFLRLAVRNLAPGHDKLFPAGRDAGRQTPS